MKNKIFTTTSNTASSKDYGKHERFVQKKPVSFRNSKMSDAEVDAIFEKIKSSIFNNKTKTNEKSMVNSG